MMVMANTRIAPWYGDSGGMCYHQIIKTNVLYEKRNLHPINYLNAIAATLHTDPSDLKNMQNSITPEFIISLT